MPSEPIEPWQTIVFDDLEYVARVRPKKTVADCDEHFVADWQVFEIVYRDPAPHVARHGWRSLPEDVTTDLDEAEMVFEGFTKWDHCTEFETPDGNHHVCRRADLVRLGELLARVHDACFKAMGREDENR